MKKGFTLIELLAVIVVLAIIALIAVPIVLNVINEAKEVSRNLLLLYYINKFYRFYNKKTRFLI